MTPEFARASQRDGAPCGDLPSLWTEPAIKLLVRDASVDGDELRDVVTAVVGEDATVTWSIPGLIEISAPGITKAHALQALCAERASTRRGWWRSATCPTTSRCSPGRELRAPSTTRASVRRIADHVIPSVHDEGVAHTLAALLAA